MSGLLLWHADRLSRMSGSSSRRASGSTAAPSSGSSVPPPYPEDELVQQLSGDLAKLRIAACPEEIVRPASSSFSNAPRGRDTTTNESDRDSRHSSSLHRVFTWSSAPSLSTSSAPGAGSSSAQMNVGQSSHFVSAVGESSRRGGGVQVQTSPGVSSSSTVQRQHSGGGSSSSSSSSASRGRYINYNDVGGRGGLTGAQFLEDSSPFTDEQRAQLTERIDVELDRFEKEIDKKFYQDPRKRRRASEQICGFLLGPWHSTMQVDYLAGVKWRGGGGVTQGSSQQGQQQPNTTTSSPTSQRRQLRELAKLREQAAATTSSMARGGGEKSYFDPLFGTLDNESMVRKLALGGKNSLTNMGNTCFMNCGLQCMIHLEPVVAFFLSGKFKYELNFQSRLGSKDATVGIGFAEVLLRLWTSPSWLTDYQEQKLAKSGSNGNGGNGNGSGNDTTNGTSLIAKAASAIGRVRQTMSASMSNSAKRNNPDMTIFSRPGVNSYVEYKPQRYLKKLGMYNRGLFCERIEDQEEQDVQEFITWLLDVLSEDLNLVNNRSKTQPIRPVKLNFRGEDLLRIEREFGSDAAASLCWARDLSMYQGFMVDVFQGQSRSTVTCSRCRNFSRSYEKFNVTSLPMKFSDPRKPGQVHQCGSLVEALRAFSAEELLTENDQWFCPVCKMKTNARKRIEFWKLPFVFVLHLKRFEYDERHRRWNKNVVKMRSDVTLDLTEFEHSRWEDDNSSTSSAAQTSKSPSTRRAAGGEQLHHLPPATYDVVCSANHMGSDLESGHYTATCRHPINKTYYYFDDDDVTKDKEENVVDETSYVLFLMRRTSASLPRQTLLHPENWPHRLSPHFLRNFPVIFERMARNAESQAAKDQEKENKRK